MILTATHTRFSRKGERCDEGILYTADREVSKHKERYRQAVECILERDRAKYRTQAEYLTAAILSFEGSTFDEQTSLRRIGELAERINQKVEMLCDGSGKR